MLTSIQMYIIYGLAALSLIAGGYGWMQTSRLDKAKKDLSLSQMETQLEKQRVESMSQTMRQLAQRGDELQDSYNKAQEAAQKVIDRHRKKSQGIANAKVPQVCTDAVEWAIKEAADIEQGWSQ